MASSGDLRRIGERAAEVEAAHAALDRNPGEPAAVARFQSALEALYTPGWSETVLALQRGEAWAIGPAVDFLVADPRCYRSGYEKEVLCRYLSRLQIPARERTRLLPVAEFAAEDDRRPMRERKRWRRLVATMTGRLAGQ